MLCLNLRAFSKAILETKPSDNQFQLENGLRVYLLPSPRASLSAAVLAVKAGTSQETQETNGYLHLLEHCLIFRQHGLTGGDQPFKEIRDYGLYYNAHTEPDLMFFEICLSSEHLIQGLSLLKQIVFNFDLKEPDLESEKAIILKELADLFRVPQKVGLSKLYQLVFPETGYALPSFGNPEIIKKANLDSLR
ncbi:MAG: M16 family metallopeptidase, partial [Candidatus Saccharicenans sp.]